MDFFLQIHIVNNLIVKMFWLFNNTEEKKCSGLKKRKNQFFYRLGAKIVKKSLFQFFLQLISTLNTERFYKKIFWSPIFKDDKKIYFFNTIL